MANLLGKLLVRLTAETADFQAGMEQARAKLGSTSRDLERFRMRTIANMVSFAALGAVIKKSIGAADELDASQVRLAASAKLTGVGLGFMQQTTEDAQKTFKLSATAANLLTVQVTKLTSGAGQLGKSKAALGAFLDLGAARGLNAADTLEAVRKSVLGVTEGTEKLFGMKADVIFQRYAAGIGTVAGALTESQRKQAVLNAALSQGAKVSGEYDAWLKTSAGSQYLLGQSMQKTEEVLGKALQPALVAVIPVLSSMAGWLQKAVQGWQMIGATAAIVFSVISAGATLMTGGGLSAAQFAQLDSRLKAWRETIAEIQKSSIATHGVTSGDFSSPDVDDISGKLASEKKKKDDALQLAGQKQDILLQNQLEIVRGLIGAEVTRLGHAATLTDKLSLQRSLVESEYLLQKQAVMDDARLSEGQRSNELLRLELMRQREQSQLRMNAAVEKEVDAREKAAKAQEEAAKQHEKMIGSIKDVASGLVGSALSGGGVSGSQIGSGIGSIAANFLPGGSLLTGIGGFIGGLFGHKKPEEAAAPVIQGLDAIERAQKETVTAIQVQTDALLKPENRLLNLPSTFNVPAYAPAFGGGGITNNSNATNVHIDLTVNSSSGDPQDIRKAVADAVGSLLFDQRRNTAWN